MVGLLNSRLPSELKGHGIPNVIESLNLRGGKMSPLTPVMKMITATFTLGSGGSAGQEGPIAQIGAGIGSYLGQKLHFSPKELRSIVVAGVAAGISAIFSAPIGGLLFALEVVKRKSTINVLIPVVIASIIGYVTSRYIFGMDSVFQNLPEFLFPDPKFLVFFIFLGLACGLFSAIWIRFFYSTESGLDKIFHFLKVRPVFQPAIGGCFIGLIMIGLYYLMGDDWETYTVMGFTFKPMQSVLQGMVYHHPINLAFAILISLIILKALSTAITIGSHGSGGLFAPTLFLGLVFGAFFAFSLNQMFPLSPDLMIILALAGMGAVLAGTIRAPVTGIILIVEITGQYELIVPIAIAVIFSIIIASKIEKEDLYTKQLALKGVTLIDSFEDVMDAMPISKAMVRKDQIISVRLDQSCENVMKLIHESDYEGFPVLDGDNLVGIITIHDLFQSKLENSCDRTVKDVLDQKKNRVLYCMDSSAHLSHAIAVMMLKSISRLPVVDKSQNNVYKMVGWLTIQDIERAYNTMQIDLDPVELRTHLFEINMNGPDKVVLK
jgi:CIC family chloride channel protein